MVGQLEGRAVRDVGEAGVGLELRHLPHRRLDDLGAPVADVGVPEARAAVEVGAALLVVDPGALGAVDDELVLAHGGHVGERVPQGSHAPIVASAALRVTPSVLPERPGLP
jgi:hypothetical protein